jgi:hypothetical protein
MSKTVCASIDEILVSAAWRSSKAEKILLQNPQVWQLNPLISGSWSMLSHHYVSCISLSVTVGPWLPSRLKHRFGKLDLSTCNIAISVRCPRCKFPFLDRNKSITAKKSSITLGKLQFLLYTTQSMHNGFLFRSFLWYFQSIIFRVLLSNRFAIEKVFFQWCIWKEWG